MSPEDIAKASSRGWDVRFIGYLWAKSKDRITPRSVRTEVSIVDEVTRFEVETVADVFRMAYGAATGSSTPERLLKWLMSRVLKGPSTYAEGGSNLEALAKWKARAEVAKALMGEGDAPCHPQARGFVIRGVPPSHPGTVYLPEDLSWNCPWNDFDNAWAFDELPSVDDPSAWTKASALQYCQVEHDADGIRRVSGWTDLDGGGE